MTKQANKFVVFLPVSRKKDQTLSTLPRRRRAVRRAVARVGGQIVEPIFAGTIVRRNGKANSPEFDQALDTMMTTRGSCLVLSERFPV